MWRIKIVMFLDRHRKVFLAFFQLLTFAWSVCLFIQSRRRNSVLQLENEAFDIQIFQDPMTPLFDRREVIVNRDAIQQKIQNKSAVSSLTRPV